MKAVFLVLAAAASMLAACETSESIDKTARVGNAAGPGAPARRVVRMAPIADDDVAVTRRAKRDAGGVASVPAASAAETAAASDAASATSTRETAPASTTAPAEPTPEPATAEPATPHTTQPSTPATVPEAAPATAELSAPAVGSTPAPSAETATPEEPAKQLTLSTRTLTEQLPALFEAKVAGMPLWLLIVVAVVLLAAVAIGMSSSRKPKEEI